MDVLGFDEGKVLAKVVQVAEPHVVHALELVAALVAERLGELDRENAHLEAQRQQVRALLPAVHTVLQPIVSVAHGRDLGYEALTRFRGVDVAVGEVFDMAAEVAMSAELELAALRAALARLPELPPDTYLAVNLDADVLVETEAVGLLLATDPTRIVLELTERALSSHPEEFRRQLTRLRTAGVRIALDDVGAGHASLQRVLRLSPDVVKIDRDLIAGIDNDLARRALVTAVTHFAIDVGATLVAEGVETGGELARLSVLGVHAVEGYLLGRPAHTPWDRDCLATATGRAHTPRHPHAITSPAPTRKQPQRQRPATPR